MISDEDLKALGEHKLTFLEIGEMDSLAAELLQRRTEARKTCKWKIYRDGSVNTECGNEWYVSGNRLVNFCCFCGHKIEEVQS